MIVSLDVLLQSQGNFYYNLECIGYIFSVLHLLNFCFTSLLCYVISHFVKFCNNFLSRFVIPARVFMSYHVIKVVSTKNLDSNFYDWSFQNFQEKKRLLLINDVIVTRAFRQFWSGTRFRTWVFFYIFWTNLV